MHTDEQNSIIKTFLRDAGLFYADTWLECLPEEILTIIYKFVNDDIVKHLKGNWGANTYVADPVFPGLTRTAYDDYYFSRDPEYGMLAAKKMKEHYITGYVAKHYCNLLNDGELGEQSAFYLDPRFIAAEIEFGDLPTFRVNELQRYSPYMITFTKQRRSKNSRHGHAHANGGRIYYEIDIIYGNRNFHGDDFYEKDFNMMVSYRFECCETLKNKPVKINPRRISTRFPEITRTERRDFGAKIFNRSILYGGEIN